VTENELVVRLAIMGVFALAVLWALFWVIRLAVRYGVSDAIRMNRGLLGNLDRAERERR
jgi:putative flippase GtrA